MDTVYSIRFHSNRTEAALAELPSGLLARFIRYMERMECHGPDLGMPHTKALGNGLFELRMKAGEGIARVFYCCLSGHRVVILHHFIKKSQKTPQQHLEIARKRQQELNHGK